MSSAVETKANTATSPNDINGAGSAPPDGGGDAPPDTDPGPIKG
jgi:hypothetical protein